MSRRRALGLIGAAGALALLGAACASDDAASTTEQTTVVETTGAPVQGSLTAALIETRDGAPIGGVREIEVAEGGTVSLTVTSNTSDEVHVHGYDIFRAVGPGARVEFSFPADRAGVFEIELEDAGTQIARLTVTS